MVTTRVLEGSVDVNDVVVKLKESSAYKKVQIEQVDRKQRNY